MFNEEQFKSIEKTMPLYYSYIDNYCKVQDLKNIYNTNLIQTNKSDEKIKEEFSINYHMKKNIIITAILTWLLGGPTSFSIVYLINKVKDRSFNIIHVDFEDLWFPIVFCLAVFIFVVYRLLKKIEQKRYFQKVKSTKNVLEKENSEINIEVNKLEDNIEKVINQINSSADSIIPFEYWLCSNQIYSLFKTKRVDNLKEALNLVEEMNHKERVESLISQGNRDAGIDRQLQWNATQDQLQEMKKMNDVLDRFRK